MSLRPLLAGLVLCALGTPLVNAQAPPARDPNVRPVSATVAGSEKPAAVVNGEPIAMVEVKRLLDARPYPVTLPEEQKKALQSAAIEMLVSDLLMRQYLRKQVPQVDPADYTKEMQTLAEALKKQNKTIEQLLKETGQSAEQLRADVISRLQWKALLTRQLPEASLKKYYDDNKVFFDKVFVKASHILIKLAPNASTAQKEQARQKLLALRQDLVAGRLDFADAAKKYSDCPSKDKGGDLGQFPYKFVVVDPFARAAFSLKVGEVSDVVTTEFGVHLLKVMDRTAGEPSNFEAMRDSVREVWAQDVELYQSILAEQRKTSKVEMNMP